ncbi:MAG: DUF805 domain-containing protein [Alphaproteobacteria bacterium]
MITQYINCFKKYFKFKGRSTRSEYIAFITVDFIIDLALYFIPFANTLYSIIAFIPSMTITSRRLHDVGISFGYFVFPYILIGAYVLPMAITHNFILEEIIQSIPRQTLFILLFIYLFYQFIIFYWLLKKSDKDINKYGLPKEE